jgi:hypothetical protein
MIDEDHEWIKLNTGQTENSCACSLCRDMCKTVPCMGTPGDILRIINNGFIEKLIWTDWAAGVKFGIDPVTMIQPRQLPNGHCSFLTADNKCELHDKGIKPIEGKLAAHNVSGFRLSYVVARTWFFKRNDRTIELIAKAYGKHCGNKGV